MKHRTPQSPMRVFLFGLGMLLGASQLWALTTVYKVKHPDGSVTYSDAPIEGADVILVEPVPTIPAVKLPPKDAQQSKPEPMAEPQHYDKFTITQPAADSAFYSGDGQVSTSIELSPSLRSGHRLEYWLDGKLVSTTQATSIELGALFRGTHTLTVKILDARNKVVDSRANTFTVHRPTVKR